MKEIWLVLFTLFPFAGFGQATLSVDKTEIRIGDQIRATILAELSQGMEWINSDAIWVDTLKAIALVSGPEWNKERANSIQATWTLAIFDTGWVHLPNVPVIIRQGGDLDTFYTNDVPVRVLAVEPDSTGLRAIKEIYKHPFDPGYYKRFLPHALLFILAVTGLYFWFRRRKKKREEEVIVPIPPQPHEWAYKALEELSAKKLWQRGEIKEHYTNLTAILREYLERRYGIHALEQTSDEILIQLTKQNLSPVLLKDTEELLSAADLIKFAKADPGIDLHAETIERVRSFVVQTTPSFQAAESINILNDNGDEIVG